MIDFKDKMIEIAEETYGVDIKKITLPNRPNHLAKKRTILLQYESTL